MIRNIVAVVVGLFAGSLVNMAILFTLTLAWPLPEGLDMNDPAQMAGFVGTLLAIALVGVVVAHLSQAGLGGWIAARLGSTGLRSRRTRGCPTARLKKRVDFGALRRASPPLHNCTHH